MTHILKKIICPSSQQNTWQLKTKKHMTFLHYLDAACLKYFHEHAIDSKV